jgi:hypothetical protein
MYNTVKLIIIIATKIKAIITPSQKHKSNVVLNPNSPPKISATRKRTVSNHNMTKIIDLKYSQVGLVSFSNLYHSIDCFEI